MELSQGMRATADGEETLVFVFSRTGSSLEPTESDLDKNWARAEDTLHHWFNRARRNVFAHQEAAAWGAVIRLIIGCATVGVTVSLQFTKSNASLSGILTACVTGLAVTQTFVQQTSNDAKHVVAANLYSSIRRKIEVLDATPRQNRGEIATILAELGSAMDEAGKVAPPVHDVIWSVSHWKADRRDKANEVFRLRATPPSPTTATSLPKS